MEVNERKSVMAIVGSSFREALGSTHGYCFGVITKVDHQSSACSYFDAQRVR